MILAMFVLVTQQYGWISWGSALGLNLQEGAVGNGYYIMTNATVDDIGNTIIKTMDTTGYFNVVNSERSKYRKTSGSASASA